MPGALPLSIFIVTSAFDAVVPIPVPPTILSALVQPFGSVDKPAASPEIACHTSLQPPLPPPKPAEEV